MFELNPGTSTLHTRNHKRASVVSSCILALLLLLNGAASKTLAQAPGESSRQEAHLFVVSDKRASADTSQFPFSAIVKLKVTFPDGTSGWGTGALIGPSTILTAEHVVFNQGHGGHAEVEVYPGYAYGESICKKTRVISMKHGAHQGCHDGAKCDIAVLTTLDRVGCNTGWFGFKQFSASDLRDVFIAGYPSDLQRGEKLYFVRTKANHVSNNRGHNILEYTEWTAKGMSGGPIFTSDFYIVGIHTNSGWLANYGVGLCNQLEDWVSYWRYQSASLDRPIFPETRTELFTSLLRPTIKLEEGN